MEIMERITKYSFTPQACIERLEKLQKSPDIKVISLDGGGIENGPYVFSNDAMVFIHRDELREILGHLQKYADEHPMTAETCDFSLTPIKLQ